MVRSAMKHLKSITAIVLFSAALTGCQSNIDKIGQEHAKEVIKWQELARYAGNELKYLGLTVTAGVQIEQAVDETTYSIINVHLDRDTNNTEIDLLSPEFAEKLACGAECHRLSIYNASFATPETQLTHFFLEQEGRFFEFYGRLTLLNETLAYYRKSSPDIFKQYINWMVSQQRSFDSLSEFFDYLDTYITEDKLLAFSKNGFISPVQDRLSPAFLDDLVAALPQERQISAVKTPDSVWQLDKLIPPTSETKLAAALPVKNSVKSIDASSADTEKRLKESKPTAIHLDPRRLTRPDQNWNSSDAKMPSDDWNVSQLTPELQFAASSRPSISVEEKWQQAKMRSLQVGSIACTFSDNSFGVVKEIENSNALLKVIGRTQDMVDGVKLSPKPGHLFSSNESFYFVKDSETQSYPLTDIATCDIRRLKRAHWVNKDIAAN